MTVTTDLAYKQLYPLQYLHKFLAQGIRPDGRVCNQSRPISLQHDFITSADASCLATIGTTTCIAALHLQIVQPAETTPNQGVIKVGAELPPMCCQLSASQRLPEQAAILAQRLQHIVGACIDPAQLVIASGTAVWKLHINVCVLDSSGSVLDAALLATMMSLHHCRLPAVDLPPPHQQSHNNTSSSKPQINTTRPSTPLTYTPAVACSMVWVPGLPDMDSDAAPATTLLIDPDAHEQALAVGEAAVVTHVDGSVLHVYCCYGAASVHELIQHSAAAAAERRAAMASGG